MVLGFSIRCLCCPCCGTIFETFSFVGCFFPAWDVHVYGQTGEEGIVGFEWDPEYTDVVRSVIAGLLSVVGSPELVLLRPWTIIAVASPWVSYLDKFLPIFGTTSKLNSSNNTVGM